MLLIIFCCLLVQIKCEEIELSSVDSLKTVAAEHEDENGVSVTEIIHATNEAMPEMTHLRESTDTGTDDDVITTEKLKVDEDPAIIPVVETPPDVDSSQETSTEKFEEPEESEVVHAQAKDVEHTGKKTFDSIEKITTPYSHNENSETGFKATTNVVEDEHDFTTVTQIEGINEKSEERTETSKEDEQEQTKKVEQVEESTSQTSQSEEKDDEDINESKDESSQVEIESTVVEESISTEKSKEIVIPDTKTEQSVTKASEVEITQQTSEEIKFSPKATELNITTTKIEIETTTKINEVKSTTEKTEEVKSTTETSEEVKSTTETSEVKSTTETSEKVKSTTETSEEVKSTTETTEEVKFTTKTSEKVKPSTKSSEDEITTKTTQVKISLPKLTQEQTRVTEQTEYKKPTSSRIRTSIKDIRTTQSVSISSAVTTTQQTQTEITDGRKFTTENTSTSRLGFRGGFRASQVSMSTASVIPTTKSEEKFSTNSNASGISISATSTQSKDTMSENTPSPEAQQCNTTCLNRLGHRVSLKIINPSDPVGKTTIFECDASNIVPNSTVIFIWYRQYLLSSNAEKTLLRESTQTTDLLGKTLSKFLITNVSNDDSGTYTCSVHILNSCCVIGVSDIFFAYQQVHYAIHVAIVVLIILALAILMLCLRYARSCKIRGKTDKESEEPFPLQEVKYKPIKNSADVDEN